MTEALGLLFNITIIAFMAGNLAEVGLRLQVNETLSAAKNVHFLLYAIFWCFIAGPATALLVTFLVPLSAPYALGLAILGLAPCTPAMPLMVKLAGGSRAYMSTLMVVAYSGTIVMMPVLTPLIAPGLSADASAIARPLVLFVAVPCLMGMLIRAASVNFAEKLASVVKQLTSLNTVILVGLMVWLYWADLFSAVGTFAAATQISYYLILGVAAYAFSRGLPYEQKSVMVIGVCTRNVGPALTPLVALEGSPPEAIAMCILAVLLGAIISGFTAALIMRHYFSKGERPQSNP